MPTLTLQPDGTDGVDTSLISVVPDTNWGTLTTLRVGERNDAAAIHRALIKFDLTDLPADATIISATLSLTITQDASSNTRTYRVYRMKRAWVESEATWNIYSTGNSWQTAGGFGSDDCEQTDIGSREFSASETGTIGFSLTPTSKAALDLGNGWLIKADTEVDDAYFFFSSDHGTAGVRPQLVIEYEEGGGEITEEVALVAETDTALALTRQKQRDVAQVAEADTAHAVTAAKARELALATESDVAQALTSRKARELGAVAETDAALTLAAAKSLVLAQATESDLAQGVVRVKRATLAQALERDAALAIAIGGLAVVIDGPTLAALATTGRTFVELAGSGQTLTVLAGTGKTTVDVD